MADEKEVAQETTLLEMAGQLSDANKLQKSVEESSLKTNEVLISIAKILQGQLDLEEQNKLDKGREFGKTTDDREGAGSVFDKLEMPTSVADSLGLLFGGVIGLVTGFFSELRFMIGRGELDISKQITKLKNLLGNQIAKLKNIFLESKLGQQLQSFVNTIKARMGPGIKNIKDTFALIPDTIKSIGDEFKRFGKDLNTSMNNRLKSIKDSATKAIELFKKAGEKIVKGIKLVGKGISAFFNFFLEPLKDITKLIPKPGGGGVVSKAVDAFRKFFKMFQGFFKGIGKLLARIAYPITLIFGLFEAVSQATKDFDSQEGGLMAQITAGAFGFIKGLIGFMVTDLMDLVKSAFSWIVEKIFGPDNPVTKFLDSFSFTELFKEGIDIIRDFFLGIPKYFKDAFKMGGGVFGALDIFVDDIIDTVTNILGFLGEILGKIGQAVLDKIPEPFRKFLGKVGIGTSDGGDSLDQAGADLTAPSNVSMTDAPTSAAIASVPEGVIRVGGNKGTVTNAAGEKRDLSPEEVTAVRSKQKDERLVSERKMHQETIDNNAGDDSQMARRKTNRAKSEILRIDKEIALRDPASAQGKAEKIGTGTIATALNPAPQTPMVLQSSANAPSSALLGNEGSAVNQGQALQSGTSNLNDAKSRQNNAPPMVLQSSANNSKTTNSKVSNNYSSSNVAAWDIYDPFSSQMPSGGAK